MAEDAGETARRLAEAHSLRFIDLTKTMLAPGAASLLPEDVARRHGAVPMGRRLGTPVIAVGDPDDLLAMDMLRASLGREFVTVVARADQIARALDQLYPQPPGAAATADPAAEATTAFDDEKSSALRHARAGDPESDHSGGLDPADEPELLSARPGAFAPLVDPASIPDPRPEGHESLGSAETYASTGVMAAPLGFETSPANGHDPDHGADSGWRPAGRDDGAVHGVHPAAPDGPPVVLPAALLQGPPLARVLVESGRVNVDAMLAALDAQRETEESLARFLYDEGLASEDDLVWAMAQEVGLEFVDLNQVPIDRAAVVLIPEATARHHTVLPVRIDDGVPVVAMANPTDVFAMDDLRTIMGRNFTPVVATRSQITTFIRLMYDSGLAVSEVAEQAGNTALATGGFELENLQAVVEDAPIVRYVNLLILQALNERASDIHIEPTPKRLRIRFRIDGVLHDATSASPAIAAAVVSRLKVLGEMDIAEHRIPQEGRVSLSVSDRQIDLRLATLPSIYGETVVMRLLDKSASIRTLPELGFHPDTLDRYAKAYNQPYGVILVTGPTGAGKTTTLYATLAEILTPEKSVVTVEDPVEYQIDGVTQVQINLKAGLQFSTALRSILRADPDIVLIGEIRDLATASIAMEAALSGHLVLTTLHTNTAAATPLRLTEMGIEPFLVTSAVSSVLTQRLARVLCGLCKEQVPASEKEFLAAGYAEADLEGIDTSSLYRAVGCRTCGHTGYYGRMVLAEVMNMTEEIDRMVLQQASLVEIERAACEAGMLTLRQDGLLKVVHGTTTLEEVLRVVV